jgi:hypothetical protein
MTGWTVTGATYAEATSNHPAHSGALGMEGYTTSGFATLSQTITTSTGSNYDFSFWSSVRNLMPGNILRYSLDSAAPVTVPQATGDYAWEFFTDSFTASGASTACDAGSCLSDPDLTTYDIPRVDGIRYAVVLSQ